MHFFRPPPLRFSFLPSILYHSSSLSLPGVERKTFTVPSPHLLPICNHMIFDRADRVRERRREGRREKRDGSRKRDEKCKNIEGRGKRKTLRVPLREERRKQGAGGVRPPPPVHPLIFEKPAVTTLKNV